MAAKLAQNIFDKPDKKATRDGFGDGVFELGEKNPNVVALCADLTESVRLHKFQQKFQERFYQAGVAEQNMIGVAGGLSLTGKIPFAASFAVFVPMRTYDQIRISLCYNDLNVKFTGGHAGLMTGEDGATHQALEDIAIMRVLPRMTVLVPSDYHETKKAVFAAAEKKGPVYIRIGRAVLPMMTTPETPFKIGRAETFADGSDVSIIACGTMVYEAMLAAKELDKEKINARVINMHTIKPLDAQAIARAAKETGAVVTAEEHQINGGLGSAVSEVLAREQPVPVEMVAVKDTFGESGKTGELMKKYGLTSKEIIEAARKAVKRRK